jgi:ATP-dependent RNA helicase DDX56/DBP9
MKHVPKYLLPRIAAVNAGQPSEEVQQSTSKDVGFVAFNKRGRGRGRGRGGKFGSGGRGGKKSDPLKKFR